MNRLAQVLHEEFRAICLEFPRSTAIVLADAIAGRFDSDSTIRDITRPSVAPESLPLCATPEPEPENLEAALEASLEAVNGVLDDGFGNVWAKCKPACRMQIVRPGKVQCDCDGLEDSVAVAW